MAFQPLTEPDLLALWRTLFPRGYTRPIETEASGQGLDLVSAHAVQFARAAEGANNTFGAIYLRPHSTQTAEPASGARYASAVLEILRAPPATGAITLIAGVEFVATIRTETGEVLDGVRFRVLSDTLIPAGSLGPVNVPVLASRVGWSSNVPAGSVDHFALRGSAHIVAATIQPGNVLADTAGAGGTDRLTPAMVGQYVRLVGGVNGGTVPRRIISVTQPTVTDPHAYALLDGAPLAAPDTTTYVDVLEFADLGLTVTQPADAVGGRDGWLDAIGAERNAPRQRNEDDEAYRLRLVTLDDVVSPGAMERIAARVLSPLGIPWRIIETRDPFTLIGFIWDFHAYDFGDFNNGIIFAPATRYFAILVGPGNQGEFGFAYDAPYPSNAYDATNAAALNAYDGYPISYYSALAALWAAVERARAAGIAWDLVLDPDL